MTERPAPGAPIPVMVTEDALVGRRRLSLHPAGTTLDGLVAAALDDDDLRDLVGAGLAAVFVGGVEVPAAAWSRVRVKPGIAVDVVFPPHGGGGGGGGKNPVQTVVSLAAIAVGAYFGGPGGIGAAFVRAFPGTFSATLVQAIGIKGIGYAIMGAGFIASRALSSMIARPPSQPAPSMPSMGFGAAAGMAESKSYSITGTRNELNAGGIIPRLFGRRRIYPTLAMTPRTRLDGDDQYFIQVFAMEGPLRVVAGPDGESGLRIGDTPIERYEGVRWEIREGWEDDAPLSWVQDTVREEQVAIDLAPSDEWAERVTDGVVDRIAVDVTCGRGLFYLQNDGTRIMEGVLVEVQYAPVGTDDWQPAPWDDTGPRHRRFAGRLLPSSNSSHAVRRGGAWSVDRGQYRVRFRRPATVYFDDDGYAEINPDMLETGWPHSYWQHWQEGRRDIGRVLALSSDPAAGREYTYDDKRSYNDVAVSALRSIEERDPINDMPGLWKMALEIQASGQLNGIVDRLNFVGQAVLPVWDGAEITDQETRHPAWAFLEVCRGRSNATPAGDARIGLDDLQAWAAADPDRTFDAVVDSDTNVEPLLREIAAAARASLHHDGQRYTVLRDVAQLARVEVFTPRNSWGFRGTRKFAEPPHALRCPFVNAAEDYEDDERIVYWDGYDETNATLVEAMPLVGHTDADQVYKDLRFHLAQAWLRGQEEATLFCNWQALKCRRGSRVGVAHDVPRWGLGQGRVLAVETDGAGKCSAVTLDETLPMEDGGSYQVIIRHADDVHVEADVVTVAGGTDRLEFLTPLDKVPQPDDLVVFGETDRVVEDFLVTGIGWDKNLNARLDLVPYAPDVYQADQGAVPAHQTTVAADPDTTPPAATVTLVQDTRAVNGRWVFDLVTDWRLPDHSRAAGFEVWRDRGGVWELAQVTSGGQAGTWTFSGLAVGEVVRCKIIGVSADGRKLPLAAVSEHRATVVDDAPSPAAVQGLRITRLSDGVRRIEWTRDTWPATVAGLALRISSDTGADWADMTPLHQGLLTSSPYETRFAQTGDLIVAAKLVDADGRESTAATAILATIDDPRATAHLASAFEHEDGWPGLITDGYAAGGDLYAVSDGGWIELTAAGSWPGLPDTWSGLADSWDALADSWGDLTEAWSGLADSWDALLPARALVYETAVLAVGRFLRFTPTVSVQAAGTATVEVAVAGATTWGDLPDTWDEMRGTWGALFAPYQPLAGAVQGSHLMARVTVAGETPQLTALTVHADALVETEYYEDVDTAAEARSWYERLAAGHFRIASLGGIDLLTTPSIRAIQGVGQGWTWELVDKNAAVSGEPAAEFKIYDAAGALADAVVDIELKGVVSQ